MKLSVEPLITLRFLKGKNKKLFLHIINLISVLGVTIGVTTLIVVMSVMNGFDEYLKQKIIGVTSHITVKPSFQKFTDYKKKFLIELTETNNIKAVSPVLADNVLLKSDYGSIAIYLKGIIPEYDKNVTEIHNSIIAGDKNFSKHSNGIYLGVHLAKSLNVKTGDIIRIIPAQITFSALGIVPGIKKVQVSGIYKTGLYEYDSSIGYCSLNTAEKIFRKNGKITHYEISVFDIDNADATANIISQKYNLKYYAYSWMTMNKNLFTALKLEKTVMFIILTLIIGVAALNIASSIIVLVVEKTKEIGILRALGLSKNSIMRIFMFKGFFIGIIGSVSGTILGLLINFCISKYKIKIPGDVYFIENLPVKISDLDIMIIAVTAIIICILASLYPAYKSSKLDPVEAIRNE